MNIITAILESFTQTDEWNRLQETPAIQQAESALKVALSDLPADIAEEIEAAAFVYATRCEQAALLYGIGLSDTIRKAGADPAAFLTEE